MKSRRLLVTGGAGFIGSNFLETYLPKYPDYQFICIDLLTYASNNSFRDFEQNYNNFVFAHGDIRNGSTLKSIFNDYAITDVIHFAAESHVDNSITSPDDFISTNINGTFQLLKICNEFWDFNSSKNRFLHVSTDEVYGSLGSAGYFTEKSNYAPNSPYSASKASSDFLVRSFHHTYGLNMVITNCSNNFGPQQHDEKLIPTIIRNAINNQPIPIYGNGLNIRDWLYVKDHCIALDKIFHNGSNGETYLIGGNNERTNLEIARTICSVLDELSPLNKNRKYAELITFVKDRKGHDFRYAIDSSKLKNELGWLPQTTFENGIQDTIKWYKQKYNS